MATGRMQYLSESLNRITEFSFVLSNDARPEDKAGNPHYDRPPKTLYLLHGLTGIDTDWLWGGGNAHLLSKTFNLNIFMPTCGNNFYLDRPGTGNAYGKFVGKEFVEYTRTVFGLSERREDTYIGGLSMGGYGTLMTVFAYPETFAGAIALSSANPGEKFATWKDSLQFDLAGERAFYQEVIERAYKTDPKTQALTVKAARMPMPKLYMACGTEDELLEINQSYRDFFAHLIPESFRYEEGSGIHDWRFWTDYMMRGLTWMLN